MSPRVVTHLRTWLGLALAVSALAGCRIRDRGEGVPDDGGDEDLSTAEQEVVDDSSDVEASVQGGSGLAVLPTFAFIGRKEPLTLARAVQLQTLAPLAFQPQGCARVETVGNVVTYTFDGCTGPLGLVTVSGREVVTFRPGREVGSIEMEMASEELTIGGRAVEHDATAVFTVTETGRRLTYDGTFSGITPTNKPVTHTSDLLVTLDDASQCVTLDGTTSATVGPRGVDTTFDQLQRCAPITSCPSGTITATGKLKKISVGIAFDGTDTAIVTTPKGREIEVDLPCEPR